MIIESGLGLVAALLVLANYKYLTRHEERFLTQLEIYITFIITMLSALIPFLILIII